MNAPHPPEPIEGLRPGAHGRHAESVVSPGRGLVRAVALTLGLLCAASLVPAQQVPHNQDRPPGPALGPDEARGAMRMPQGFRVEIFASEPDIVNPVAMTFDARGRIWITESLEYPRREPGPGKDRIKIVEDSDGNGKADTFKVFAEGLNIPSGIAIGNHGVYVCNSPDILFLRDTDGDDRADESRVVVTGFGRDDTHELPSTLTWGPDGWLYGLNGVFNGAHVVQKGKDLRFDAALWRYHPVTEDFELFAQGTSNPWGLAFDSLGSAFVSACVIDHLYHLTETGYYHRQAGAYPPFTWKIESVVRHHHQKAAYCGLALYDADLYPEAYRDRLFMGNIHGNCINVDRLERAGSTYLAQGEEDFLQANDAWFMPVSIKLAPDGCFYVLDWYDRYHCYQDANRDPQGIDRLKGRIYRLAYGEAPSAGRLDLEAASSQELLTHLRSPNLWWRAEAKRVLAERLARAPDPAVAASLEALALDSGAPLKHRLHALWTLLSASAPGVPSRVIGAPLLLALLSSEEPALRAWGVRAAAQVGDLEPAVKAKVIALANDAAPDVRLQTIIAARKLLGTEEAMRSILQAVSMTSGDPLLPRIAWRNLEPLIESAQKAFVAWAVASPEALDGEALRELLPRILERALASSEPDLDALGELGGLLLERRAASPRAARGYLEALIASAERGALPQVRLAALVQGAQTPLTAVREAGAADPLFAAAVSLGARGADPGAVAEASRIATDPAEEGGRRQEALSALSQGAPTALLDTARALLAAGGAPDDLLRALFAALGRIEAPEVAALILEAHGGLPAAVRPQALDLLTQRRTWADRLTGAVEGGALAKETLNLNQLRRLLALKDEDVTRRVTAVWGRVRTDRNREREKVIEAKRKSLAAAPCDPWRGRTVFEKTCLQCHVIFGKGNTVGPDLTVNGRQTLDTLLSSLLDPNLVIGAGYQAWTVVTHSGRVVSGLLVEDSPQRVVLKVAGGTQESFPRGELSTAEPSEVSLMPEDLEKTLTEEEFRDLVSFLRYDEEPPPPVETQSAPGLAPETCRIHVEQSYGLAIVKARSPGGDGELFELLRLEHSNDQRPFVHPLFLPGSKVALTALRPEDHPWQYGLFTGHASVQGSDCWREESGWIRSRGLESVREGMDHVELVARSDWLTQRRGGDKLLEERLAMVIHPPGAASTPSSYAIDVEWTLTPVKDLTLGRYDYGGLAYRPAAHNERRDVHAEGEDGHRWQDASGVFGEGADARAGGVAIFDHPSNPGFPSRWRVDGQGLINPAITARAPLSLKGGTATVFRYRVLVHEGPGDAAALDHEWEAWAR